MQYHHKEIEAKWQKFWEENQTFRADNNSTLPKYYVLDMFPYPSGAGLHVGHPLGYIASDIFSRYKRLKGFNVLHPMGYDSFGLPAEQYAIQTGQHPAVTTQVNIEGGTDRQGNQIEGYEKQLKKIGLGYDWEREVRTSDPDYYKWTQWIFIQLFNSYYDNDRNKACPIDELINVFEAEGNSKINAANDEDTPEFTSEEWNSFSEVRQQEILLKYRLTYLAEAEVNWCPGLGTVLANDEVVNGVSERGGFPVIRKKMTQWMMRITAYSERLLNDLEKLDWPEPIKDAQTYWIGKSKGSSVIFSLTPTLSKGEGEQPGYMTRGSNAHLLIDKAKEMRKNPTSAENFLWQAIRNRKLSDKFRRQHLIDDFIVDFVCLSKGLVIEVDGGIHEQQKEYDEQRTLVLNEKGFEVIRFTNEEVMDSLDEVLKKIELRLKERTESPLSLGERQGVRLEVFTTRPDTIYGVSYVALAPEHPLVAEIVTSDRRDMVMDYVEQASRRSEIERMAEVDKITGIYTGANVIHPLTGEEIPVWVADYVLSGYGTGAVMGVPAGDERDYKFAWHFNLPIINIFEDKDISVEPYVEKGDFKLKNSGVINGMDYPEATERIIAELEAKGCGQGKTNYRLRDAVFSRQRYWGEPVPAYYKDKTPYMIGEAFLPLILPEVDEYLPTETGEPPLGRAKTWAWDTENNQVVKNEFIDNKTIFPLELNTMPGWAGSSWYFLRYMSPHDPKEFVSKNALEYWQDVDLYMGGSEHATGHLLYSRFWHKFLFDRGWVPTDEYAKKLINQGMIQGMSAFAYRLNFYDSMDRRNENPIPNDGVFISKKFAERYDKIYKDIKPGEAIILYQDYVFYPKSTEGKLTSDDSEFFEEIRELVYSFLDKENIKRGVLFTVSPIHADISLLKDGDELDTEAFKKWRDEYAGAKFILEAGKYMTGREVEKMSKSKYNVVNPDDICEHYGADTLRLYEMFLGPIEQSKPWNTQGISGVYSFMKKLWKLYHNGEGESFFLSDEEPKKEEMKALHQIIKKVDEDVNNFSFNTSVSGFMIAVNELTRLNCNKRAVLEPLIVVISPYAPHIAEELWNKAGHDTSVAHAEFPEFDEKWLIEDSKEYPISFNGKVRFKLELPAGMSKEEIEEAVMSHERTQQQLEGRTPKKVIVVPGKIVNIVG